MAITAPAVPATTVAQLNTSGQAADVTVTGGTVQGILVTPSPAPPVATPAVPASTVNATNNNLFPVAVTVTGGTVTAVVVNGSTIFTTSGVTVVVPIGGTVSVTYSAAPTWAWSPLVAGIAGNPVASPSTVPFPPNASVSLIYSAAPTWSWTDPPNLDFEGYAGSNTSQNNPLAWPWYQAHGEVGQPGLGFGVSN